MDDPLEYANMLLGLVAAECDADKRTKTARLTNVRWSPSFDTVVTDYASAMEILGQHARHELRLLDALGL